MIDFNLQPKNSEPAKMAALAKSICAQLERAPPMETIEIGVSYDWALARIYALMDADPDPGTAEFAELEKLTAAVLAYENEHYPMDRGDTLITKHGDVY